MNHFTLSGTLLQKPELRYTAESQTPVCTSLLEFVERTKDANTSTIKVVAWGKLADVFHSFTEGANVLVEGSVKINKIETAQGHKENVPEFNIARIESFGTNTPQVASTSQKTVNTEATVVDDDDDFPFE